MNDGFRVRPVIFFIHFIIYVYKICIINSSSSVLLKIKLYIAVKFFIDRETRDDRCYYEVISGEKSSRNRGIDLVTIIHTSTGLIGSFSTYFLRSSKWAWFFPEKWKERTSSGKIIHSAITRESVCNDVLSLNEGDVNAL